MGKKELKKQYEDLNINIIDYVEKFDPTSTNKLMPFLLKQLSDKPTKGMKMKSPMGSSWLTKITNPQNRVTRFLSEIMVEELGGKQNILDLQRFAEHLENGRIEENDVSQYKDWSSIQRELSKADLKLMDKELSKQTQIIHEDDTWLFLKPLSLKASQTYGNSTKWCTTMKNEPTYFYRYSANGILIYTINKKNGRKYGFYSSPDEFSVWDTKDKRIDSMETRIPVDLLAILQMNLDLKTNPKNDKLFSDEEKKNRDHVMGGMKKLVSFDNAVQGEAMEEVAQEVPQVEWEGGMDAEAPIHMEEDAPQTMEIGGWTVEGWTVEEHDVPTEVMTVTADEVMEAPAGVLLDIVSDEVEATDSDDDYEPRGADTAFGNAGMAVGNAPIIIGGNNGFIGYAQETEAVDMAEETIDEGPMVTYEANGDVAQDAG